MVSFLACGASVVNYVSRIIYAMAREGSLPGILSSVAMDGTPRPAILCTVILAAIGLLFGLAKKGVGSLNSSRSTNRLPTLFLLATLFLLGPCMTID
ncbi:MAG: amino acid permease [Nitrospira sp.]|nr:amino acid permease [Nitrospira sp.]